MRIVEASFDKEKLSEERADCVEITDFASAEFDIRVKLFINNYRVIVKWNKPRRPYRFPEETNLNISERQKAEGLTLRLHALSEARLKTENTQ